MLPGVVRVLGPWVLGYSGSWVLGPWARWLEQMPFFRLKEYSWHTSRGVLLACLQEFSWHEMREMHVSDSLREAVVAGPKNRQTGPLPKSVSV